MRGSKTFKFKIPNQVIKVQHLLFPLKMKTQLIYQLKFFLSKAPSDLLDIRFLREGQAESRQVPTEQLMHTYRKHLLIPNYENRSVGAHFWRRNGYY